jgi:TrmH family RNA methyltransferase
VFITQAAMDRHKDLVSLAAEHQLQLTLATEKVLEEMADTVTPQGVVAVCGFNDVALGDVLAKKPALIALLHQVQDPGNVGNIIRTADAAGADAVVVTAESVDVFNPKAVRASTGSIFHVPVVVGVDLAETITALRAAGVSVVSVPIFGKAESLSLQTAAAVCLYQSAFAKRR